jgi:S-DNA-T family DNA segregation ATPase FtsK/SpoIIIE
MRTAKKLLLALNSISPGFSFIAERPVICGTEHAYRLPMGKCANDVQMRIDAIGAAAGAPVEIVDRGGAVVLRVVEKDFPHKLQFNPADMHEDKLLIGYNRLMDPIYHRPMHLLAGGAAGSGKTVWLRFILYQLAQMRSVVNIADLKGFSFFPFESLPGFKIAKSLEETADLLHNACIELDRREQLVMRTRNRNVLKGEPYYVVVIDEAAQIAPSMYTSKEKKDYAKFCDECVARIAQKGREPKVILIYCTQRPDAKILNGQVKSNVEAALSFRTYTNYDSRIILNTEGAERISVATPGRCIFRGDHFHNLQVPFISEEDLEWDKLLAPLKVEVLHHGSSKRTEPPRQYIEGSFTSADSDNETTGNAQRFAGPAEKSIAHPSGTHKRTAGQRGVSPQREGMVAYQTGTATNEYYTDEIE